MIFDDQLRQEMLGTNLNNPMVVSISAQQGTEGTDYQKPFTLWALSDYEIQGHSTTSCFIPTTHSKYI